MTITTFQTYCMVMSESFVLFLGVFSIAIFMILLWFGDITEFKKPIYRKIGLVMFLLGILSFGLCCFLPNAKQAAAIIVLPKIINNDHGHEIPEEILILSLEWLKDTKSKKE